MLKYMSIIGKYPIFGEKDVFVVSDFTSICLAKLKVLDSITIDHCNETICGHIVVWISLGCTVELSKLLYGFVKVVTLIC